MPTSRFVAAFAALALTACAHGSTHATTRWLESHPGGRDAQPQSGPTSLTPPRSARANRVAPDRAPGEGSYLGGRSAQPAGWLHGGREDARVPESPASYAYQGGRAGQPYGGPIVQ